MNDEGFVSQCGHNFISVAGGFVVGTPWTLLEWGKQ
jgi:hypothetical protein